MRKNKRRTIKKINRSSQNLMRRVRSIRRKRNSTFSARKGGKKKIFRCMYFNFMRRMKLKQKLNTMYSE